MVVALLTSMKSMLSSSAQQNKEFKNEAIKNNRNMSSVMKDISKMFESSRSIDSKQNASLDNIEAHTMSTSGKVDNTNSLLRESISIQGQMLSELRNVSKSLSAVLGGGAFGQSGGFGGSGGALGKALTALGIGGAAAAGLTSSFFGTDSSGGGGGFVSGGSESSGGGGGGTYKPGQAGSSSLASTNMSAAEKAILETISKGESSGKYNIINYKAPGGGGRPQYFEMSENAQHPFKGKKGYTAAGRYQFLWSTWAEEVRAMGEDPNNFPFTPENQDKVAVSHAKRIYKAKTRRDLLQDIQSEDPKIHQYISSTLRPTWHGIKGGSYLGSAYQSFKGSQAQTTPEGGSAPEVGDRKDATPVSKESAVNLQQFSLKPPSHVQGLDSDFSKRLGQFLSDAKKEGYDIKIYSGYRDPKHQERLWQQALKKYGSPAAARKWVAPPGRSRHNKGIAADLKYLSKGSKEWAHKNAGKYGLHFRMGHEPWHIEPTSGRGSPSPISRGLAGGDQMQGGSSGSSVPMSSAMGISSGTDTLGSGSSGPDTGSGMDISSALGMLGVGNPLSMLSSFFGVSFDAANLGSMLGGLMSPNISPASFGSSNLAQMMGGQMSPNISPASFNPTETKTITNFNTRSSTTMEAGGEPKIGDKKTASLINYNNSIENNAAGIQNNALEMFDRINTRPNQNFNNKVENASLPDRSVGVMADVPPDFFRTPQPSSGFSTTAFWAPQQLITRPGNETDKLRWGSKLYNI